MLSFEEAGNLLTEAMQNYSDEKVTAAKTNALANLTGKFLAMHKLKLERQKLTGKTKPMPFLDN